MTVIYICLGFITIMQLISWAAQASTILKQRELEKVFDRACEMIEQQKKLFDDMVIETSKLHDHCREILKRLGK